MTDKVEDRETGIAIRFISHWDVKTDRFVEALDLALVSCLMLGHTWQHNEDETVCTVCGMPKPLRVVIP